MSARARMAIIGILGVTCAASTAHAQISKDVTQSLMSAASLTQNDRSEEAKQRVDQAAAAARTPDDWRAVAEAYRRLGDDERWSWALDRSSRVVGRRWRRW